ncbi:MAG: DUF2807 domain-containing protein [Roseiflexaceae bacterium]|nr:DUF2807 domain-containing protein [Roseiflexaceae bacterium]
MTVRSSGVGQVSVSGMVQEQDVALSGVGNYDGTALVSDRATVEVSGVGNVLVNVRKERIARAPCALANVGHVRSEHCRPLLGSSSLTPASPWVPALACRCVGQPVFRRWSVQWDPTIPCESTNR